MVKREKEYINCELRYYQGDVNPEMLSVLKECWPTAYKAYLEGNDISLNLLIRYKFHPDKPLARLAPFFCFAKGYSFNSFTSNGLRPPVAALFEAIYRGITSK